MDPSPYAIAAAMIQRWASVGSESECWPYRLRNFVSSGNGSCIYGRVYFGHKKRVRAHRAAYEAAFGEIPVGACVCHRCDNPLCCNPAHLFVGSQAENVADKMAKKRHRALAGDMNPNRKLDSRKVSLIRARISAGESVSSIASSYGVSAGAIHHIRKGDTWSHVA